MTGRMYLTILFAGASVLLLVQVAHVSVARADADDAAQAASDASDSADDAARAAGMHQTKHQRRPTKPRRTIAVRPKTLPTRQQTMQIPPVVPHKMLLTKRRMRRIQ